MFLFIYLLMFLFIYLLMFLFIYLLMFLFICLLVCPTVCFYICLIGAEDIRMQLPEEAKKFDAIDKTFKAIMTATSKNPNVVDACTADNRLQVLITLSDRLDSCQKSLSDYLDTKRCAFPRFFFISDDELLSVLGNNDPTSIQVHLLKLFDNVKEMQFSRNNKVTN